MHRVCRLQTFAWLLLARRRQDEKVGYVDILGVDPEHQDRGLGTSLLGSALAAFVEVGLREAQLGVDSGKHGSDTSKRK